ncbi:phage tail protein [Thalassotalea sp. G20_0]|uniref:phage tail protein n=1 Tax=Thalassotalea sp. G20_0 TaxID=2821093 RepID=UPI001ADC5FBE|nr:phage tail protein [Thalassotalea sp. G20_0]MBO9493841.1 phage tail protein [Thalassotalea sp. G20_0]
MAKTMLALGDFRFSVDTAAYQRLRKVASWRWAKKDTASGKPGLDYIGPDLQEVSMNGTIYPHYKGGLGQVPKMKAMGDSGTPQRLVDGLGNDLGLWAISRLEEIQSQFHDRGVPLKIDFDLSLMEYPS